LTLWLAPIVLFGLAVVLQHTRQLLLATGSRRWTVAFDATAVGVAALLVLGAARIDRSYPTGSLAATQQAMKELGPNDVLLVTRPAMFSFAFNANTPTEVQATPDRSASFIPRFADDRIHAIDFLTQAQMQQLDEAVASADRVLIVDSNFNVPVYGPYRVALDESLSRNGFELESSRDLKHAKLIVWRRR
jgi:hypothetical protein